MKKIIVGILVFSSIISTLSPLSAFANEPQEDINTPRKNAFGIVPYQDFMYIRGRDIYSNDNSHPDKIQEVKSRNQNPNYTGKFDPRLNLGGVICGDAQKYDINMSPRSAKEIRILTLACKAWRDKEFKSYLTYYRDNSESYYSSFEFTFLAQPSTPPYKDHLVYYEKGDQWSNWKGFFMDLNEEERKNLYTISGSIYANTFFGKESEKPHSMASIKISASQKYHNGISFRNKKNKDNAFFLFGTDDRNSTITPVFNNFTIQYPEGYLEEDQIKATPEINKKFDWYPRPAYSLKDKNLRAMIYNRIVGDTESPLLDSNSYQPCFEIYPENSTEEKDRIFRYCGSRLFDNFVYNFENYGVYKLKTFIQPKPPLTLGHKLVNIIQPVFTRLEVNGGNYSFIPTEESQCSGDKCDTPTYALSCGAVNDTIERAVSCEFNKMDSFFRKKIGLLYVPVDVIGRLANNFKNASGVSCSFVIDGKIPFNICVIEEKMPALLTFIRMVANGSLLIAFVLFLRSSLVGFLNSKGDE